MNNLKTYETQRLILKQTSIDDAGFILELLNTPKWLKYIGDRHVHSVKDAIEYIATKITPQFDRLGFGNFIVIRKNDNTKVGTCGLYDREGIDGVDIGFGFLPDYEKKGYAFEASIKIKELALETFKLKQINAITDLENLASQKLLAKLGLKYIKNIKLPDSEDELMFYQLFNTQNEL